MQQTPDPIAPFSDMLRRAIGRLLDPQAHTFLEMLSSDVVMEFPYAPPGGVERLDGRAAVGDYVRDMFAILELLEVSEPVVHVTEAGDVVILEFEADGRTIETGRRYRMRYISVITVRDGYITRYVDYWNPLTAIVALGQFETVMRALEEQADG